MSDDDSDYDFADLLFDEDWDSLDERSTADALAENVIPSPVWTSCDPRWDIESPKSDWEEYLDEEFYDDEGKIARKREVEIENMNVASDSIPREKTSKEKVRMAHVKKIPELEVPAGRHSLLEPTVIWRSRSTDLSKSPIQTTVAEGCGKKVSLLSDWREKFNIKTPGPGLKQQCFQNAGIQEVRTTIQTKLDDISESLNSASKAPQMAMESKKHSEKQTEHLGLSICRTAGHPTTDNLTREKTHSKAAIPIA